MARRTTCRSFMIRSIFMTLLSPFTNRRATATASAASLGDGTVPVSTMLSPIPFTSILPFVSSALIAFRAASISLSTAMSICLTTCPFSLIKKTFVRPSDLPIMYTSVGVLTMTSAISGLAITTSRIGLERLIKLALFSGIEIVSADRFKLLGESFCLVIGTVAETLGISDNDLECLFGVFWSHPSNISFRTSPAPIMR